LFENKNPIAVWVQLKPAMDRLETMGWLVKKSPLLEEIPVICVHYTFIHISMWIYFTYYLYTSTLSMFCLKVLVCLRVIHIYIHMYMFFHIYGLCT
jgi:hypothetical protein